jgi:hypothetical protein
MKTFPKARSVIAAMLALSIAGSGSAWADKHNGHQNYGHGKGGHQNYGHGKGGHYNKHYSYNKYNKKYGNYYYKGGYKYPYYRGYGNYYYNYDNDNNSDENLLIGLLVGGLVGYAINGAHSESYPPPPPPQQPVIIQGSGAPATCLQEREYQMKVIVGGRQVDAYGTACLQPDGSWTRGPAQVVSQ